MAASDLDAIHAGQKSILRALSANGELLQAILDEITKPQKSSEVAEAVTRLAMAVEAMTGAVEANTAATGQVEAMVGTRAAPRPDGRANGAAPTS